MLKAMSQLRSRVMVMAACFVVIVGLSADYGLAGPRGRAVPPSRPGRVVVKLPAGHRTVMSRGVMYFYHGGIFYRQASFVCLNIHIAAKLYSCCSRENFKTGKSKVACS